MKPRGIRALLILVIGSLVALFCYNTRNFIQDDSYIFYTYVRNLLDGNGYVFNLGERVNATTSPLYTLIVAGLGWIFRSLFNASIPATGHFIGCTALFIALLILFDILMEDGLKFLAVVAPLFILANTNIILGVGMETFLTIALMLGAIRLYQLNQLLLSGFVSGLAVLSRPDSILIPICIALHFIATHRRLPPLGVFLLFFVTLLPWIVFSYFYFGSVIPNTLGAKLAQTESGGWGTGLLFLKGALKRYSTAFGPRSLLLIGASTIITLTFLKRISKSSGAIIILLWGATYLVSYGLILNPPAYRWYFTPLAVPIAVMLGVPIQIMAEKLPIRYADRFAIALLAVASMWPLSVHATSHDDPKRYLIYTVTAEWLAENAPPGATVACNEVGILGYYYSRGRLIDGLGLVTKGADEFIRNRDFAWYIDRLKPDFLVFSRPPRKDIEGFYQESWFESCYTFRTELKPPGQRGGVTIYERISRDESCRPIGQY